MFKVNNLQCSTLKILKYWVKNINEFWTHYLQTSSRCCDTNILCSLKIVIWGAVDWILIMIFTFRNSCIINSNGWCTSFLWLLQLLYALLTTSSTSVLIKDINKSWIIFLPILVKITEIFAKKENSKWGHWRILLLL